MTYIPGIAKFQLLLAMIVHHLALADFVVSCPVTHQKDQEQHHVPKQGLAAVCHAEKEPF